ncbi:MAG: hypothetical protein LBE10_10095 [Treponema sp.]|nr:hypothetical protein [Treponema sp.]
MFYIDKKTVILFILLPCVLFSCSYRKPVQFRVKGTGGELSGLSRDAVAGRMDLSCSGALRYSFSLPVEFPGEEVSAAFSYRISGDPQKQASVPGDFQDAYRLVLRFEGGAWELPWSFPFPGPETAGFLRYVIPVERNIDGFSISLEMRNGDQSREKTGLEKETFFLELELLKFTERWFGLDVQNSVPALSPFVAPDGEGNFTMDVPSRWRSPGGMDFYAAVREGGITLEAGALSFETDTETLSIPAGMLQDGLFPLSLHGEVRVLAASPPRKNPFPEPLRADPGIILQYPERSWRDTRYEVFRWEDFPSILIFDFANLELQDLFLKRLAFFVEKEGFRGRLAADGVIRNLHGWNAHDYRAEDLARFFEAARSLSFPLNREERELESLLLSQGIIRREDGSITAGEGAIISLSRESPDYLRFMFMAHEAFHGIFFIDEDFRDFSRRRWENLGDVPRRFIRSYFEYQAYDVRDTYLLINEFMAHVLQQPSYQARKYFGETLASRIDASPWRRAVLPEKDEENNAWPEIGEAFEREAEAFSAYVRRRWGLSAGFVRRVRIKALF